MNSAFETDLDAYKTDVADRIAPAGYTAFNWQRPGADPLTPEQIKAKEHCADMMRRYYARKAKEKAQRVNKEDFCISPTPQADRDKTARLVGRNNGARSQ
jgi:hypothetical protein